MRPLLLLAAIPLAFALDPSRAPAQYARSQWQVEHGLPRNYVSAVLRAPDGWLLVGTDEALARFDGARFTPWDAGLGLSGRWVLSLLTARDKSLWVGTFDGGIYRVKDGRVLTRFESGASAFALLEDQAGRIWASTRDGVFRSDDGRTFVRVPGLSAPPETAWNVLAAGRDGSVWIVTGDGLRRWSRGRVERVLPGAALSVAVDRAGTVWAGMDDGLVRVGEEKVKGIPGPVVAVLEDRHGSVWASSWGTGLYRWTRSRGVDGYAARDGLADNFVRTLYEDGDGNLWIGSRSGGLARWRDPGIVPYGVPEGIGSDFASVAAPGLGGDVWLATWRGGLYRLRGGRLEAQPTPSPSLYFATRALAVDSAGHQWLGNWEGLYEWDGRRYRQWAGAGSPFHLVAAVLFDRRGRLWVGTSNNGVFLFPGGSPGTGEAVRFLPGTEITALHEDPQGRVWAGTAAGAGWLDERDRTLRKPAGMPAELAASVSHDSRGTIWVPTMKGRLVAIKGERVRVLGVGQGLPGHPLYRLVEDRSGAVWISSQKGILRVEAAQLAAVLDGSAQRVDVALHDNEDGMRTVECHRLSQPSGALAGDGTVWFPTTRGFVQVLPPKLVPKAPPAVQIETAGPVQLAPGRHNVEFRFTAPHFESPGQVRFRYRMEGFDPSWIEAGGDRVTTYNRLPPGSYRFLVAAREGAGPWSETPASLEVRQLPRFWQTMWFLILMGGVAVAVSYGLYRWRLRIVRGRYDAVLAERHRISREWHDTLLAGFSAISWQLEETLSRLRGGPAAEPVQLALKMVGHYRGEARRVIHDLRDTRPEGESLAEAVEGAVRQSVAGTGIEARVEVTGEQRRLPDELERNVLRICQEAAANAVRHARAERLEVKLDYASASLLATVRDDGTGFDPAHASAPGHFGLIVMRERAQRFGGDLRVRSAPGSGTVVETTIPLEPL